MYAKSRQICIEQCEAAQTIKAQFGLTAAFDYLISEKLMRFDTPTSRGNCRSLFPR